MAAGRKLVLGGPHRTQGMRLSEKPGTALCEYECGQPFRLPRQGIQDGCEEGTLFSFCGKGRCKCGEGKKSGT